MRYLTTLTLLFLMGCATWTPVEKKWLAASWIAVGADLYTTERALNNPNNYETNPILKRHPNDTKLIAYMITSQTIVTIVAHFIPRHRKWILGGKVLINTGCAVNNSKLDWGKK